MKTTLAFFLLAVGISQSAVLYSVNDMDVTLQYQISRYATNEGSGGNYWQTYNAVSEVDPPDAYTISLISWTDGFNALSSYIYLSGPNADTFVGIEVIGDGIFPDFPNNAPWSAWETNTFFSAWDAPNYHQQWVLPAPTMSVDIWVDWNFDGSARVNYIQPADFGKYLWDGSINPSWTAAKKGFAKGHNKQPLPSAK